MPNSLSPSLASLRLHWQSSSDELHSVLSFTYYYRLTNIFHLNWNKTHINGQEVSSPGTKFEVKYCITCGKVKNLFLKIRIDFTKINYRGKMICLTLTNIILMLWISGLILLNVPQNSAYNNITIGSHQLFNQIISNTEFSSNRPMLT